MSLPCLPNTLLSDDVLTLDVEDHCLRALQIREASVQWWAESALPPRAVQKGRVVEVPTVAAAIRTLLVPQVQDLAPLSVSLGGCGSVAHLLIVSTERGHLNHAILQQVHRELVGDQDDLYLSWQILKRKNGWQKVLLLGVDRQVLDTQSRALSAAGLSPQVSSPKALALACAIDCPQAVIADLEPERADIVVVTGQLPVLARSLNPVRENEGQVLDWLAGEIRQIITVHDHIHGEISFPETEILVGGSQLESSTARDRLASLLGRPCRLPGVALETPPDFPLSRFLVNVGLALCSYSPPLPRGSS